MVIDILSAESLRACGWRLLREFLTNPFQSPESDRTKAA